MKARYCPCLGVKRDRESFDIGFVCALGVGGTVMNVRYRVELHQEERDQLARMLSGGKHAARRVKRAQILLAADAGESDEAIAANVSVGGSTVYRTKRRFVLGNLEAALSEAPRPGAERKMSGKQDALLVATACPKPAQGHVVHSSSGWRLCGPDGGRARSLRRDARSEASGGVLRREPDPTDRRGTAADPGATGPAGTL